MGALGLAVKDQVEALIDDDNLRSLSVVNSISFSEGNYGGYSQGTATVTATAQINVIPSNYVQTRIGLQPFGDLEEGEIRFLMKSSETIDAEGDTITFQGIDYIVREIKPIYFNEETIAKAIVLSQSSV